MSDRVNASIPLQFNPSPIGPNIGQSIGAANQLLAFQQNQQQVQRQNALRTILGTPGAIDATGQPTPETMTRVMGVDPNVGLQLQQNALVTQQRKLQMDALTTKTAFDTASYLNDAYSPILEQYQQNIEKGMPPDAAMHEAQQATTDTTERLQTGGGLPPNVSRTLPTKFDQQEFQRRAMQSSNYMQWWREQDATKKQQQLEQRSGEQTWTDATGKPFILRPNMPPGQNATYLDGTPVPQDALGGARKSGAAGAAKPEDVTVDGKRTQAIWQGNRWVDLEGNPIPPTSAVERVAKAGAPGSTAADREAIAAGIDKDPNFKDATPRQKADAVEHEVRVAQGLINTPEAIDTEAQQIASYSSPPLTGYALRSPDGIKIMARVQEIDPSYSAPEYGNYSKTIGNFGSGKQGDTIRYINNAIQHIDVMQKAADALGSGDMRTFNSVANTIGREFGVPAPTTFDGLRQIVGTEIERAATGGVGAAVDRDRLIDSLDKANSPEQLRDVFKNFKALFGGQANSLKTQYESGTPDRPSFRGDGPFSFDRKLLPETRAQLPGFEKTARATPGAKLPPAQQDTGKLTAGAKATPEQMNSLPKPALPGDAMKLPPGSPFVLPDGTIGIVPQGGAQSSPAPPPAPQVQPAPVQPPPAPFAGTATNPLPLTRGMKPTDLAVGKVYNTKYGPATWDGKQFTAVQ